MPSLNADQMIAEAEAATGLVDWGGDDFRAPLQVLTNALNDEAQLHAAGERMARRHLHDVLCGRLRMADDRQHHTGIAGEKIVAPVFVIGLPRSGTTFLHNLLTQDPNNRAPATWEIMYPSPPPERAASRDDPRIAQCQAKLRDIGFLDEGLQAIHPFGARRPEECNFIWEYTLRSVNYMAWWHVPSYTQMLYGGDMRPVYESHRRFLQHLQHRHAAERWVLKTPAHMAWLDTLLAVYPDACLIQCHRDPAKIIPSLSNNLLQYRKLYSTLRPAGSYGMLELQSRSLARVDALRARPDFSGRFIDAPYADVQADPMAVVRRIYGHFGMPLAPETEAAMQGWLTRDRSGHAAGAKHQYDGKDFGVDAAEIDRHFGDYIARYNIALER
ncbi:sulfotransferase family protein [Aquabacterium sp.]|uniref:sulfotransferase family protein n=1 Tax=Aquabacterium sp. TaxID=1872578 RepID=UPI002BEF6E8F|nr:sulfotransferase [Aquabacterium sp.]HSW03575.1 sulfotransferase [Aquabacterium sp.]